ncbi:hypothetical protein QYE76_009623 [Lolium multiflorum]|uniref:Uncharacterized protein n=1 Tax=Lolium multiflorum TaxID=4521 RepID=A0AAD8X1E4_LOLMU|nr:hypothetical protein QYE76_009623 [Lolium multiflorum]
MEKKKNPSAAASSTSVGAAAKSSSILPKEVAPNAPPPAPPAPPSSAAKPGDWTASTVTKRDEKRSRSLGLISSDEGNVIFQTFAASEDLHNLPNDTSEGRGSSEPIDSCTVEHTSPSNEPDGPIDSETAHTNLPPSAGDTCDTEGSVRNDDADHNAFVDAAPEETRASPMKRSIGGFADEDDLLDFDDTFIEPPPKRARSDAVSPAAAASEASALKAAPVTQASTASSLSKGKDAPAAAAAPPSLEGAIKKAAVARQEVDSLKEELNKLKERLKEEEARAAEKDELLRQSALALLEAVFPVPSFVDDSSGVVPENDQIQRMKDRIAQMEKDLRSTYALAVIINKKSETAADVERYALTELHKATESLNCLLSIANVTGDLEALYPKVLLCEHNCRQTRERFKACG